MSFENYFPLWNDLSAAQKKLISDSLLTQHVKKGTVRLVASTFEWSEDIDVERALRAKEAAEKKIKEASDYEERAAEIKLKRALTRIRVGEEGH